MKPYSSPAWPDAGKVKLVMNDLQTNRKYLQFFS
jgi:hypothetical protein